MAINRAPFNALIDDDGTNTVGSIWNKSAIDAVILTPADAELALKAPVASPAFTGTPTAPTATPGTNTTQLATTAFIQAATVGIYAPLNSPAFTGTPTAPTATAGTNTTQLATTAFVATAAAKPVWTAVAFNAANFVGTGSMTWTVDAGDMMRFSYVLNGTTMVISFWLEATTLSGTATNQIKLVIPAGKASAGLATGLFYGGSGFLGTMIAGIGATFFTLTRVDGANYTLGTNTFTIAGTITFEVQ